jgi:hypothetical protein
MNWNIKKTKTGIEITVVLGPRELAREPLVGVSVNEARQYLEESGHKPGRCLNPGALAGNLDTTRLTATWFFEDAPKSTNRKAAPAKKGARTTKDTNKGS